MYRCLLMTFALTVAPCAVTDAEPTHRIAQQLPADLFDDRPDELPEMGRDPGPTLADPSPSTRPGRQPEADADQPEELAVPDSAAATDPDPAEASRLVQYNASQNPWLPTCDEELPGWLPELPVPPQCLDCKCDGATPGKACQVWRSFQKPTHPSIDQDCVVCVKEPCLGYEKVHHTVDAVVQKCFESQEKFCDRECADGRCIEKEGMKTVKQLHPCTAKVKLFYWKPVIKYRDVYYYINCEPCYEGDTAVAQR